MNRLLAAVALSLPVALALSAGCSSPDTEVKPTVDTLQAPAKGQGFQFGTPLFSINPGDEVQDCYFFRVSDLARSGGLPDDQPVNLHRVQLAQKTGSHHMNIFRVNTIQKNPDGSTTLDPAKGTYQHGINGQGECFRSSNWSDWPLVANTQQSGDLDWTFPDGVARVFQPGEWLMLQTHYVNASSQATPDGGEVKVNFWTIPAAEVQHEMGTMFATTQSIRICKSNPTPTYSHGCSLKGDQPIHIIGANGHFHSRGTAFDILAWDGTSISRPADDQLFYHSDRWSDPPMLRSPELDRTIAPGGGVFYSCSYQWTPPSDAVGGCAALDAYDKSKHPDATPDCCYDFGPIVEKNEHCNAFVYYWPKAQQGDVFCN
jgi:hypothetical protein